MTNKADSTVEASDEIAVAAVSRPPARHGRLLAFSEAYALLIMGVLMAVFFTLYSPTSDLFLTSTNLRILVGNQAVPAIVALAALIPLVCNEFDLSVGSITGVAAVFIASVLSESTGVPIAILVGVSIGAAVGLVNAVLVTRAAVNGVITTLGTSALLAGVVSQKTGGFAIVSDIPPSLTNFGINNFLGIPLMGWALAVIAFGVYFLLEHTPFGRQTYAVGSNITAANLVGLRTRLIVGASFVIAGILSGIAGIFYVARAGGADPGVGPSYTLSGLAAAFLSAAAVRPGRFNVGGTLVAVFFLAVLNNGLELAGAPTYVASYVNGAALILGVALAMHLSRRRSH